MFCSVGGVEWENDGFYFIRKSSQNVWLLLICLDDVLDPHSPGFLRLRRAQDPGVIASCSSEFGDIGPTFFSSSPAGLFNKQSPQEFGQWQAANGLIGNRRDVWQTQDAQRAYQLGGALQLVCWDHTLLHRWDFFLWLPFLPLAVRSPWCVSVSVSVQVLLEDWVSADVADVASWGGTGSS